jgi:putative two-component system response regulator
MEELGSSETEIVSLARTIEARDEYTEGHCERLATYAVALGHEVGLPDDALQALQRGGFLHDLGKVAIPDAVLSKKGPLTDSEREVMQQHTVIGDEICARVISLGSVRPVVRHHHEKLDGSGYPDGLRGDGVPLLAQIMGIVDVYDALTTTRPYRRALSTDVACGELRAEARRDWRRADLVDTFVGLVDRHAGAPAGPVWTRGVSWERAHG